MLKKQLFEYYPCLHMKFRLKKHENQLSEIIYNERFVNEIGYTLETFAVIVQQEGIPQ